MFAFITPEGRIIADSSFQTEAEAWWIGLGFPDQAEIDEAKRKGYRVCQIEIRFFEPTHCEHGIRDGIYCEPCNLEYKRAQIENEGLMN